MKLMHPFKSYRSETKSVTTAAAAVGMILIYRPCFAGNTINNLQCIYRKLEFLFFIILKVYNILLKIIEGPILSIVTLMQYVYRRYFENQFYDLVERTCNGLAVFWPTMDLAEILIYGGLSFALSHEHVFELTTTYAVT